MRNFASEVTQTSGIEKQGLLKELEVQGLKAKRALDALDEARVRTQQETDKAFGGRSRRTGQSFLDFVGNDLDKLQNRIGTFADNLTLSNVFAGLSESFNFNLKAIQDTTNGAGGFTPTVGPFPEDVAERGLEIQKIFEDLNITAKSIGDSLGAGIAESLFEAKKLSDVITDIGRSLAKQVVSKLVGAAVTSGLTALGLPSGATAPATVASANGNVFNNGNVVPFANGGAFLNGPTLFPLAGGKTGLGGEDGPEAILPLRRRNGKLGVESGGNSTNLNVVMNVQTRDADSFNQSKTQILADLRASLGQV